MDITTTDLSDFGFHERQKLIKLLVAWHQQAFPREFYPDGVMPMLNKESRWVFLTNSEHEVAMLNGDKLEIWHYCGNCGHEGFNEDCQLNEEGCNECMPCRKEGIDTQENKA